MFLGFYIFKKSENLCEFSLFIINHLQLKSTKINYKKLDLFRSKSVCGKPHEGSNPSLCAKNKEVVRSTAFLFCCEGIRRAWKNVSGTHFYRHGGVSETALALWNNAVSRDSERRIPTDDY